MFGLRRWRHAGALAALIATQAPGDINLEWRPATLVVEPGQIARLALYAVSDSTESQSLSAMDVVFAWDPRFVNLLGLDSTGGPRLLYSGFPDDPYYLNERFPPQDGDGIYTSFAYFGEPVDALPEGTLITTFLFAAEAETPETTLTILDQAGTPPGHTVVYAGDEPNKDVTGTLGSARITIGQPVCPLIAEHTATYHPRRELIECCVELTPEAGKRWTATVELVGPLGRETRRLSMTRRRRRCVKFASQGSGAYAAAVLSVTDADGQVWCEGRFESVSLSVP